MPHLNILLAMESESLVSQLSTCLKRVQSELHIFQAATAEAIIEYCSLYHFDVVIADQATPKFSVSQVLQIAKRFNFQTDVYILFDSLDETAISTAIHQGATSFALKANPGNLVCQIENRRSGKQQGDPSYQYPVNARHILHALLNESSDSIWAKDKHGKYLLINPAGANFLGKPIGDIIGKTDVEVFPPATAEKIRRSDLQVMSDGKTQTIEDLLVTPDGSHRTFLAVKGLLKDEQGEVQGLIGTVRDITDRKHAENALRESEQRFRLLVEGVKDYAIYMLDREGYVTLWNIGAERLQGYTTEEVIGQHVSCFYPQDDLSEARLDQALTEALEQGFFEQEGWRVRRNGTQFWANVMITPIYNDQAKLIGFSNVVRDMSERRNSEQELQYYADKLAQSNKELEQFALIASHDLQAPLRKIRMFSELLKKYISEDGQVISERLQASAERMQQFITDLMALSRVNRKGKPFRKVELKTLIEGVLDDLLMNIRDSQAQITLGELGAVKGDDFQLTQLFLNLLNNSLKFRKPDTAPQIKVKGERLLNGFYQITVQDNGIGFNEEYLERIFQPFERLHGESTYSGTGMGLAICHKIIQRHGGQITAVSQEGVGSTFIIYLPVFVEPSNEEPNEIRQSLNAG